MFLTVCIFFPKFSKDSPKLEFKLQPGFPADYPLVLHRGLTLLLIGFFLLPAPV